MIARGLTLVSALLLAGGAAAATAPRPALRVVTTDPLRVDGSHFARGEPIAATLAAEGRSLQVVRVRASRLGTFTALFDRVTLSHCAGFSLSAVGAGGSRAKLTLRSPACRLD